MRLAEAEIRDLEGVADVSAIELLAVRLTDLVGSPLSVNALREDLQVSHGAVSRWLEILERLYAIFRVKPFGAPPLRAVKKAQKHYHYDWIQVRDRAARFENLVAMHLLKWAHHEQDGRDLDLRYFRDVDGREVDFVVTDREVPVHLIEVKWSDRPVDKALRYLHARFTDAEATQISATGTDDYRTPDAFACSRRFRSSGASCSDERGDPCRKLPGCSPEFVPVEDEARWGDIIGRTLPLLST